MSGMLLCRSRQVNEPYYVEELGIYLYSGEELSYYIYHNAALIDDDFLEERLFRFIGQELGMEELEMKLRKWASQAELSELLLVILQDIHYYDSEELFQFRESLRAQERRSAGIRMKEKGDALFRRGRYAAAGNWYDRLLHSSEPELGGSDFRGEILYARGMTHARQYNWQEAADCLWDSYLLSAREETLKHLYRITKIDRRVKLPEEAKEALSAGDTAAWDREMEEAKNKAASAGKAAAVTEWLDKDKIRLAYGLRELVREWKNEYRISLGGL